MAANTRPSLVGVWDGWNRRRKERFAYADTETYRLGAEWLGDCSLVEDWGAGGGWLGTLIEAERYRAIDGGSPFADVTADLTEYRSNVPGIFMRHVLEHNYDWAKILANALASFTERMALILFTPVVMETREIAFEDDPGVPTLALGYDDLVEPIEAAGVTCRSEFLPTVAHYGGETIVYLEKP